MAANVLFVIIPGHWELVRAKEAGREPDPRPGILGKQRSVHNNYLTLPVLFTMLAGHLSFTYGARPRLGGARRADGRRRRDPPLLQPAPRGADALVDPGRVRLRDRRDRGLAPAARARSPRPEPRPSSFAQAQQIVQNALRPLPLACTRPSPASARRPRASSSTRPSRSTQLAAQIKGVAVDSTFMPLGNATHMTDAERDLLGQWIAQGAKDQVVLKISVAGYELTARSRRSAPRARSRSCGRCSPTTAS